MKSLTLVSVNRYNSTNSSYYNRSATISREDDEQYKYFLMVVSSVGVSGSAWMGLQNLSVPADAKLLVHGTGSDIEEYVYLIPAQGNTWTYSYQSRGYIADYVYGINN